MVEEGADHRYVEILSMEGGGGLTELGLHEVEQQPEGVSIGGNRARAGVALMSQPISEKCL